MNKNKPSIITGTVSFWVEHSILTNGDKTLLSLDPDGGSILIAIENSELKIAFIVIGGGRTDISYPTNKVTYLPKHMVAFTWDLSVKTLKLYIDGELVREQSSTIDIKV